MKLKWTAAALQQAPEAGLNLDFSWLSAVIFLHADPGLTVHFSPPSAAPLFYWPTALESSAI